MITRITTVEITEVKGDTDLFSPHIKEAINEAFSFDDVVIAKEQYFMDDQINIAETVRMINRAYYDHEYDAMEYYAKRLMTALERE